MRILILNTFPVWGGDEKWTINVGIGLMEKGHFVVISSSAGSAIEQKARESGLETFPFHIGPDIAFWKIPPFQHFLKKNKINAVLCVQNRDVKIGGLAARLSGIPAIFARQGLDTIKRKLDHRIAFTRYIDGIITNTRSIKELYEGYGWFRHDFIHVVYDGLTLPDQLPQIDLHAEFKLKKDSKVIMGTGRLAEQKRFDLLIEAAKIARKENQNWSFIIAGTGDLLQSLQRNAKKQGVDDMIKFIGFREDVLALMNSSDLFVLSSDSEGMSNALREAMGVGRACVATEVFGVSELFQDGKYGIMVERGNAEAIFRAIKSIFSDAKLKSNLENNAAELIRTSFTMSTMIDRVERLFQEQIEKNP